VWRQVKDLMHRQKKLNREALAATGLGGAQMHTDLEHGAQHLLDLQEHVDTERATEKEGKASKLAWVEGFMKNALQRSIGRHAKKQRRSGGSGSSGGQTGRRGSDTEFALKLEATEDFAAAAMKSFIERSARMEWLTKVQVHANHPTLGEHQGSEDAFVEAAVAAHRVKMRNVNTSKSKDALEASSVSE